jgi:hypothetical protein
VCAAKSPAAHNNLPGKATLQGRIPKKNFKARSSQKKQESTLVSPNINPKMTCDAVHEQSPQTYDQPYRSRQQCFPWHEPYRRKRACQCATAVAQCPSKNLNLNPLQTY